MAERSCGFESRPGHQHQSVFRRANRFSKKHFQVNAAVTQQVECRIENPVATGSIPVRGTIPSKLILVKATD